MSSAAWLPDECRAMRADNEQMIALAEKLLRVRDRSGELVPLRVNRAQRLFEQRRARQNIVLKARQMGITTWVAARFFLRTITGHGVMTVQVAQTREAAEAIFRMVQRFWENLPEELRTGPLKRSRANVGQMVFPELDSEFRVVPAALNAGRGLTIHNLHLSELARWTGDARETLAGLRAALAPCGELVMESTPNGAYGAFYEQWRAARDAGGVDITGWPIPTAAVSPDGWRNGVVRHFMPWWMEPAYAGSAINEAAWTDEEQALAAQHALTSEQIGFRRDLEQQYGALRTQEFAEDAETCFRATGDCFFEVSSLDARLMELDARGAARHNGALEIYRAALPARRYLVAVDAAGGGAEGDFAAIEVVDCETGMQCAERQQRLDPLRTAQAAVELAREYNGATICVERNNHGAAVLAYLETTCGYTRLWSAPDGQRGWLTTQVNRPEMLARLGAQIVAQPTLFKSARLLRECRTFITLDSGRTGAANGEHDDLVMAMAIAQVVKNSGGVRK